MLTKSFIENRPVADLGIDLTGTPENLPNYSEQRANVILYLAPLFCLEAGRRDLAAFAWAWARSDLEYRFNNWTEEVPEPVPDIDWAIGVSKRVIDIVIDYRINTVVAAQPHDTDTVNLAHALHRVANEGEAFATSFQEGEDPMALILDRLDIEPEVIAILGFVSGRCLAASLLAMNCHGAKEAMEDQPSYAQNLLNIAVHRSMPFVGSLAQVFAPRVLAVFEKLESAKPEDVWERAQLELFPRLGKVTLGEPSSTMNPAQRRDFRWRNGRVDDSVAAIRDTCYEQTMAEAVEATVRAVPPNIGVNPDTLRSLLRDAIDTVTVRCGKWVPVSFFTQEDYERFQKRGTLSIWESVKRGEESFDHRFSDNPLYGQSISDARVWGEKGNPLTKAHWLPADDHSEWAPLARMYGAVAVVWNVKVDRCATLTLGSYRTAQFALPATLSSLCKAMVPLVIAKEGEKRGHYCVHQPGAVPLIAAKFVGSACWPEFIELQIHDELHASNVAEIVRFDGE